jgi:dephospho-CoA kinase
MKREKVTRKEALQRIASQLSSTEKKSYADYLINTSGPFSNTRKQVVVIYQKLKRLSMSQRNQRKSAHVK